MAGLREEVEEMLADLGLDVDLAGAVNSLGPALSSLVVRLAKEGGSEVMLVLLLLLLLLLVLLLLLLVLLLL